MNDSPVAASRFGISMDGVQIASFDGENAADDTFDFKATEGPQDTKPMGWDNVSNKEWTSRAEADNEVYSYVHTFSSEVTQPRDPGTAPDSAIHDYDFII